MKHTLAVLALFAGIVVNHPNGTYTNYSVTPGVGGTRYIQGVDSSGYVVERATVEPDGFGGYRVYEQPTLQQIPNTGPFDTIKFLRDHQLDDDDE
jgi:hypothetical protein